MAVLLEQSSEREQGAILVLDEPGFATALQILLPMDVILCFDSGVLDDVRAEIGRVGPDLICAEPYHFRGSDLRGLLGEVGCPPYIIISTQVHDSRRGPYWIGKGCAGFTDSNTDWERVLIKPARGELIRALVVRYLPGR